ncbi:MAG: hypothetical protein JRF33_14285, partial [Deltaproteobacteria bacterium]|nr:hypothetical protein [Deltaproteobacteria bacterium]
MTRAIFRWSSLVALFSLSLFVLGACDSDVGGPNRAPVAVAGPDAEAALGTSVTLDGSASYDPDGDVLSYAWQVLSRPVNSTAQPVDAGSRQTSMQLDAAGTYLVALVVSDGQMESGRDVMQIRAAGCESNDECQDEFFCTVNERCEGGMCLSDAMDCAAAGDDCNEGICDEDGNVCGRQALSDGTACDDDDLFCTGAETCLAGVCTSEGNPCDPPESCDDAADICVGSGCGDGVVTGTENCDPAAPQSDNCCDAVTCTWVGLGEVDPQAVCSGAGECQVDVCDGSGGCDTTNLDDGTACGDATDSLCDDPDTCLDGQCEVNLAGAGTECRASLGVCDPVELCDGVNVGCPGDVLAGNSTECRASLGVCDPVEVCDGVNVGCPGDVLAGNSTECRASLGVCDPAEVCDGVNVACPGDVLAGNSTECNASTGICDPVEVCDGVNVGCPADVLAGNGTVCRVAADDCDVDDFCDG